MNNNIFTLKSGMLLLSDKKKGEIDFEQRGCNYFVTPLTNNFYVMQQPYNIISRKDDDTNFVYYKTIKDMKEQDINYVYIFENNKWVTYK